MKKLSVLVVAIIALPIVLSAASAHDTKKRSKMGFFITSVGLGNGADLGGLEGADAHCQALADAAGAGNRTWVAYLSTQGEAGERGVSARDRIGQGRWYNAKRALIAKNLD